jgi:cytochrome c553
MLTRTHWLNSLLFGALFCIASAAGASTKAQQPPVATMAATCDTCHGPNGVSSGPAVPTIAGFSPQYFVKSMDEFRDDTRPSTVMGPIAKGYSDDEIAAMAAWFTKRPFIGDVINLIPPQKAGRIAFRADLGADGHIHLVKGAKGLSPADTSPRVRALQGQYAHSWFNNITQDVFG